MLCYLTTRYMQLNLLVVPNEKRIANSERNFWIEFR